MCGVSAVNGTHDGSSNCNLPINRSTRAFDVRAPEDAVAPQLHLAMALVAAASGQAVEREHADDSSLFVSFTTRALPARKSSVAARPWAWITAKSKDPFPGRVSRDPHRAATRENRCHPVLRGHRPTHPSSEPPRRPSALRATTCPPSTPVCSKWKTSRRSCGSCGQLKRGERAEPEVCLRRTSSGAYLAFGRNYWNYPQARG